MAAALLVAGALLLTGRYHLTTDPRTGAILRLDRITGAVHLCLPAAGNRLTYDCAADPGGWVSVPGN